LCGTGSERISFPSTLSVTDPAEQRARREFEKYAIGRGWKVQLGIDGSTYANAMIRLRWKEWQACWQAASAEAVKSWRECLQRFFAVNCDEEYQLWRVEAEALLKYGGGQ
jgi:hypothetical protein